MGGCRADSPRPPRGKWARLGQSRPSLALDYLIDARRAAAPRDIPTPLFDAAARLIEIGERHGVRDGVAINSLLDDMTVHDPRARLWPHAERLKAHALMARLTGDGRHWFLAAEAATEALESYLNTGERGLWHDYKLPDGSFLSEPSPASSFYHIVCPAGELATALGDRGSARRAFGARG